MQVMCLYFLLRNNPVKQGKVYQEYEKLCGIVHGNNQWIRQNVVTTQDQIAKELGVDVRTIQRLKQLQQLSPDLEQLIEDGSVKYPHDNLYFLSIKTWDGNLP